MRRALATLTAVFISATFVRAGDDPHSFKASTGDESGVLTGEQEEDLGALDPEHNRGLASYFYGSAQTEIQYTTNARLQGSHDSSDGVLLPTLRGGFAFPLGKGFSLDLLGRLDTAVFADNTDRSFWGASVASTVNWQHKSNWPRLYATAEPYYFQHYEDSRRDVGALGLTAGVEQNVVFNRGRTMVFGGYSFSHYFAYPSPDDRNTNRFIVGFNQQLITRAYVQLYYSFAYSAYEGFGRNDLRQIGGLNLTYEFTPQLFGSLNSAFVDNESNRSFADYQSLTVGAAFSFQF